MNFSRRGMLILGMAGAVALLGFLAYAAHSAALSNYRTAGRLRWRLAAQQLAQAAIATARVRLGVNTDWKQESWDVAGVGRATVRVTARGIEGDGALILVEASGSAPGAERPQECAALRAVVRASSPGRPFGVVSQWWLGAGMVSAASEEAR